ncbi:MAG: Txe/YoeB family addiction module toxin [Campylobacteraceae bacterium]|jgi:toxin YoeB|nr:Txe/YoeB family addiction module toxin [Campylobacteraceae bacterium]
MSLIWSDKAWEDYIYWQNNDKKILKKLNALIKECQRTPLEGMGKPEALKHSLSGYYSRRITEEHRLIYKSNKDDIFIVQCRFHYDK